MCCPVLQILALFQTKKFHFCQTCPPINYAIITYITTQTKKILKAISNSHISLSFLFVWNWTNKYFHTFPQISAKPYSIPDKNGSIPIFRPLERHIPIWLIQESTLWVLFFKALSSHSSSEKLESWLEAEHPLHTLQTPLMDTFLDTNSTILLF